MVRARLAHRLPRPGPVGLRRFVALGAVLTVSASGYLWLRESSLVRIRTVTVTGVSSSEGQAVGRALTRAARNMTTLAVDRDELREAVREFTSVAGLQTQTDFPHGLAIEVREREPVAAVDIAGQTVPVGAGGRLMRGLEPKRPLPLVRASRLAPGGQVTDPRALDALAALAAAPEVLRHRVRRVSTGPKGLTLNVRSGPDLVFGAPARLRAKWLATARVLAEPAAAGAVYLDVRIPERVAAGGLGTVTDEDTTLAPTDPQPLPETSTTLNP